jgi:spore coat polysaccharide biosynthesis protein SpsF
LLVIVQARFSSVRLPGKVLRPLAGRPVLGRVLERIARARRVTHAIVATSDEPSDDAIGRFCEEESVHCFRGPLNDTAERCRQAAERQSADVFVRISGDSPLIAPELIDQAIGLYEAAELDLATNVIVRSFPRGMSVEVVRVAALRRAQAMMVDGEAEHVTPPFYRRPEDFRIASFASGHAWGDVQLSIDTPDDFAMIERIITASGDRLSECTVADLVKLRQSL